MKLITAIQSALLGLANTAPTYGIAVTGGLLLSASGLLSPYLILLCGVIILGIFLAGTELNKDYPSYGSAYTWASKVIHPFIGFLTGWFSFSALVLFLVYGSVYVVTLFFSSVLPKYVLSTYASTGIASSIILIMVITSSLGIKLTARFQNIFTLVELILLTFFASLIGYGIFTNGIHTTIFPTLSQINTTKISEGFLLAIFFFWGWEVVFNLSEDSKDKHHTPKKAGYITLLLLALIYFVYMFAMSLFLSTDAIALNQENIFNALNQTIFSEDVSLFVILGICLSLIGAIDIAIVESSRILVAQSRDGLAHQKLSYFSNRFNSPVCSLFVVGGVAITGVILSSFSDNAKNIVASGVTVSTILVASYYILMGITGAIHSYKKPLLKTREKLTFIVYPIISVIIFIVVIVKTFIDFDYSAKSLLMYIILFGIALYIYFSKFKTPTKYLKLR